MSSIQELSAFLNISVFLETVQSTIDIAQFYLELDQFQTK